MKSFFFQKGITLLELMLVLALATTLILMGVRVYLQFSQQAYVTELQSEVDTLFMAMAKYYQVNCRGPNYNGLLSPKIIPNPTSTTYVPVSLWNLQNYLGRWNPKNPLVSKTNPYILQFNFFSSTRNISTQYPGGPISAAQNIKRANSIRFWRMQVAIKIQDFERIEQYKNLTGASCISTMKGKIVTPCPKPSVDPPAGADYLVWERLPFLESATSSLSYSLARVNQFNQQYTNDDFYAFNHDDTTYNNQTFYETYLCGG